MISVTHFYLSCRRRLYFAPKPFIYSVFLWSTAVLQPDGQLRGYKCVSSGWSYTVPWRRKRYVDLKRRYSARVLHGVTKYEVQSEGKQCWFICSDILGVSLLMCSSLYEVVELLDQHCGFGGLEVASWPSIPKFAGSNPTEAVGFLRAKKILSTPSFGREVKPFVTCRRFTACKKISECYVEVGHLQAKFIVHFSPK